jgi:large repetitive protein
LKRIYLLVICLGLTLLTVGCASSTQKTTTTTTTGSSSQLQVTSPATSPTIDAGQAVTITANQAVLWSLENATGFGKASGALSNTSSPSTTVTYTAPTTVVTSNGCTTCQGQVSVVATSTTNSAQSASIIVFVNPPLALNTNLSTNTDCSYVPTTGNNNGTVGTSYIATTGFNNYLRVSGGTGPFTYSVSTGSLPIGLSLGSLPVGSTSCSTGCAYLYGTPSSVGCSQFQIQVTDATGANATTTLPTFVVITPPPLKVETIDYTDWVQGVPYPPVAFTVSGGQPPYTWSADPNSPLPSSLNLTTVKNNSAVAYLSGTPTMSPLGVPDLIVTDSQTPYPATDVVNTATTSGGIHLNQALDPPQAPCTPYLNSESGESDPTYNSTMLGNYAFVLHGFDTNGPVVVAGSFIADGAGNVTSGVEDITRSTGAGSQSDVTVSGSYTVFGQPGSNQASFGQVGCVTLKGGSGASAFTNTFAISLGGCSTTLDTGLGDCKANSQGVSGVFTTGRMMEFDSTGTLVTGILRQQDTSAFSGGPSGLYAFGLTGFDTAGKRYAAAGSVNASSGAFASGAADINDGGAVQSALTGGTGSYSMDSTDGSTTGRGTATLSVGSASLDLAFYVVSAHEVMLASTGTPSAANPVVSGEAITATGPFGTGSLQNSHMFHTAGIAPTGPDVSIGILSFDGVGDVTGTQYEDQAATLGTTSLSGNYNVNSSTGRVSFVASQTNPQSLGDHPLVIYPIPVPSTLTRQDCVNLASCVTGFVVSTDESAQGGVLEFQTPGQGPPPPFSIQYVEGYYFYGTDEILSLVTPLLNGASNANPNGAGYSGVQTSNYSTDSFYCVEQQSNNPLQPPCVLLHPNELISLGGTYSVNSNGTGSIGSETVAVTNGNVIFYIDESPINATPSVIVEEQ